MAADAYIRTAVAQLRTAASQLTSEARTMQTETFDQQQRLKGEINNAEYEHTTLSMEAQTTPDTHRKHEISLRLLELEALVRHKKQEVEQKGQEAANAVNAKLGLAQDLQGKASELEGKAASAQ